MKKTAFLLPVLGFLALIPTACTSKLTTSPPPSGGTILCLPSATPTLSAPLTHTPTPTSTLSLPATSTATPSPTSTNTTAPTSTFTPTPSATATWTPTTFNPFVCNTPIPTAGTCQPLSSMTVLHGASTYVSYYNSAMNYYSVSGVLPVGGTANSGVLRTAADWANYVASSVSPSGSYPIPFDPATQMLVVIPSTSLNCCHASTIGQICVTASQITVYVTWNGTGTGCVDNAGAGNTSYTESLGVILPASPLPVVWDRPCGIPAFDCMIPN